MKAPTWYAFNNSISANCLALISLTNTLFEKSKHVLMKKDGKKI